MTPNDSAHPSPARTTAELGRWTDEELAAEAREQPQRLDECFAELYRRYGRKVENWCRRICGDQALAEDASQEVFIKVQARLGTFRGDSRFSTWLYVLTRHSTLNFLAARRNRRGDAPLDEIQLETTASEERLDEDLEDRDLQQRVRAALQTELSPDEARVVVLHCLHGMTLPAITEVMQLENRSGAKALFVAAKRRLKSHFARELAELTRNPRTTADGALG